MVTDPIADLLTRIKNGGLARKPVIRIPYSVFKEDILTVLADQGFIASYAVEADGKKKNLSVWLKYRPNSTRSVIQAVEIKSRASQRIYVTQQDLKRLIRGRQKIGILSTSQGVISHRDALRKRVGGELLAVIW